jgi:hypothetical protein
MKMSENINEISKAVSTAQGEMSHASKSTVNPFFKSTYSTLTQVWDAIREPLSKNNISVFQDVITNQTGISVTTLLSHSSGQWMEFGPLEITLVKKDAQSIGSATSYAKRYALSAAIGVVSGEDDDDGEKAMARDQPSKTTSKPYEKKSPAQVVAEETNVKPVYITNDEASIFSSALKKCPEEFQDNVWKYLNDLDIQDYKGITPHTYKKVMGRVQNKLEEMSKEK